VSVTQLTYCVSRLKHFTTPLMQGNTLQRTAKAYLVSLAIWCGLSLLTGWQYRIFDKQLNINSTLWEMILLAESRGFAYALLTPPIFYLVRRYASHASRSSLSLWLIYGVGLVPFMLLYACIRWVVLPPWDVVRQAYVPRLSSSPLAIFRSGFADQITIYIAIVVAAHAYEYFERVRKQELERAEFQRALAASELQALKMQIHPHFLFNTLHGISTLVDTDPEAARTMILKLSGLLRSALEHGSSDLIPLREELRFIGEYLELEKMRFGTRLTINWLVDPETESLLVPQMILQPLVENAIRYGIAASREKGWVSVAAQRNNGTIGVQIQNNVGPRKLGGSGIGLRNTETRLKHLYSTEASLSFAIGANQIATASLILPALDLEQPFGESGASNNTGSDNHARTNC
jgi:two-component system LytT family sensor kinase